MSASRPDGDPAAVSFGAPHAESPGFDAVPVPAGRLTVIALEGIGEIEPGDDLCAAIVAALRSTPDVLPLGEDDRGQGHGARVRPVRLRGGMATCGARQGPAHRGPFDLAANSASLTRSLGAT
jgi:hypothetical protein